MKELSIEEKAQRYNEAIEKFDVILNLNTVKESGTIFADDVRKIFPELEESEDEKVRKTILFHFKSFKQWVCENGISKENAIAWLEKQGQTFTKKDIDDAYLKGVCDAKHELEKQGEQKSNPCDGCINRKGCINCENGELREIEQKPAKNIVETWKDMRLEIYQQASGNRHEPNCSDDTTKMFSLNDIDEIVEKMSEQSPSDKVELRFKVGDWVVFNNNNNKDSVYRIEETENYQYTLRHILGGSMPLSYSSENMLRLWTIADVKDGDVLACNEEILLFKSYSVQGRISLYCWYNGQTNNFHLSTDVKLSQEAFIHPATKEQRDTLMKAMANAGYTFDFEKKELKRIEQNPIIPKFKVGDVIRLKGGASEYTVKRVTDTIYYTNGWSCGIKRCEEDYELVEKKSAEWSEEDEKNLDFVATCLRLETDFKVFQKMYDWLKSLRPQSTWKPSDGQIKVCKEVYADLLSAKGFDLGTVNSELNRLEEELKKLREE